MRNRPARLFLIAAVLLAGAVREPGRWVSPAWEAYLSRLSRESPTLYKAFSRQDPSKALCGPRMEWREDGASLAPAERSPSLPPAVLVSLPSVSSNLSESRVRRAFSPIVLGPDLPVYLPPPRVLLSHP